MVRMNALVETSLPQVLPRQSWSFSSNVWRVITEIQKSLTLRIPPFKVTSRSLDHSLHGAIGYLWLAISVPWSMLSAVWLVGLFQLSYHCWFVMYILCSSVLFVDESDVVCCICTQ